MPDSYYSDLSRLRERIAHLEDRDRSLVFGGGRPIHPLLHDELQRARGAYAQISQQQARLHDVYAAQAEDSRAEYNARMSRIDSDKRSREAVETRKHYERVKAIMTWDERQEFESREPDKAGAVVTCVKARCMGINAMDSDAWDQYSAIATRYAARLGDHTIQRERSQFEASIRAKLNGIAPVLFSEPLAKERYVGLVQDVSNRVVACLDGGGSVETYEAALKRLTDYEGELKVRISTINTNPPTINAGEAQAHGKLQSGPSRDPNERPPRS